MESYVNFLQDIIKNGVLKESSRENMPKTIGISSSNISMDLKDGFPLLTTKKMFWKGIVHELLWFLRGETNIKYLVDNKVNIWNGDAYRWYCKYAEVNNDNPNPIMWDNGNNTLRMLTYDEFVYHMKNHTVLPSTKDGEYTLGDLGKVYGHQWRNQNGVDQVSDVITGLKDNPYSRYHIIDGWNKADFPEMALPPCHLLYQFIVRPLNSYEREDIYAKKHNFSEEDRLGMNPNADDDIVHKQMDEEGIPKFYLDLNMYQRSTDYLLGAPFNLASMSLLLMLFAETCNMIPGVANWVSGDTHIYVNQLDDVDEQLSREPRNLPEMRINKDINSLDDINNLTIDDFELVKYNPHPPIKYELSVGLR